MVDVIERFGWQYVAAVATDDSYGRYGMLALERESYDRKTFCIAMREYYSKIGYKGQLKTIVDKLKRQNKTKVIILWANVEPAERFLKEAFKQRLLDRTFIISEALTSVEKAVSEKHSSVLAGSFGIIPHHFPAESFVRHLKSLTPADNPNSPWWREFWETEFNCTSADPSDGFKLCDSNLKVGNRYEMLYNSLILYASDAVYALAHALEKLLTE